MWWSKGGCREEPNERSWPTCELKTGSGESFNLATAGHVHGKFISPIETKKGKEKKIKNHSTITCDSDICRHVEMPHKVNQVNIRMIQHDRNVSLNLTLPIPKYAFLISEPLQGWTWYWQQNIYRLKKRNTCGWNLAMWHTDGQYKYC